MRHIGLFINVLIVGYSLVCIAEVVPQDINLQISAERTGFDRKVVTQEFKEALRFMRTQDRFVLTEVINFLYAKEESDEIHLIGLRGTVFLLCKAEKLLVYYRSLFTNDEIYDKLMADVIQKKDRLEQQE